MTSEKAWVTLATNDTYSLGALVLAHSLKKVQTSFKLVVLVSSNVSFSMRGLLQAVYDEVKEVNLLDSGDAENLRLLARPELGVTFTKLHCWRLTQYEKCVFLDADTLVLQNCDELFERDELSAAPDVGWPDCFNSGVFVFKPSEETYQALISFALTHGSFDGGDQGLLNTFFSGWATGDASKRLPFLLNLNSAAVYSYLPAFKWYGKGVKIVHFIGGSKPWQQPFNPVTRLVQTDHSVSHLTNFLQYWWDIFCAQVYPHLSPEMSGLAHTLSQMKLEEPTPEQLAQEDLQRRLDWEQGNIDYMGKDSFDNIWSKISQSVSQAESPPASDVSDTASPTAAIVSPTPSQVTPATAVSPSPASVPTEPTKEPASETVSPADQPKTETTTAPTEAQSSPSSDLTSSPDTVGKEAQAPASPSPKEPPVTPSQKEPPVTPSPKAVEPPVTPSQKEPPVTPSQKEPPFTQSQTAAQPAVTASSVPQPESAPACVKPSPVEKQTSQSDKEAVPKESAPLQSPSQETKPATEPSSITPSSPKLPESPVAAEAISSSSTVDPVDPAPAGAEPPSGREELKSKQTPKSGGGKKK